MKPSARQNGILMGEVQEELVVYDRERDSAHCLNRTAALVWRSCNGERTVSEIAALLQKDLHPSADEDLVLLSLDHLAACHLLAEPLDLKPEGNHLSRRQVLREGGSLGVLSLLLPVVTTLAVPAPAQANSAAVL